MRQRLTRASDLSMALWNRRDNLQISVAATAFRSTRNCRDFSVTVGKQDDNAHVTELDERYSASRLKQMRMNGSSDEDRRFYEYAHMLLNAGRLHEATKVLESAPPHLDVNYLVPILINCIAKSRTIRNKGELADDAFKRIKGLVPRRGLYNCIMNAHAKSTQDQRRGRNAERWLRQTEKDGLRPNGASYNIVIGAYGSENIDDAQRIFDEYLDRHWQNLETAPFHMMMQVAALESRTRTETVMQQLLDTNLELNGILSFMPVIKCQALGFDDGGERAHYWCMKYREIFHKEPDELMWLGVLHAWAKSGRPDAGMQADLIMKNVYVTGTRHSAGLHNVWMNCWNKSRPASLKRVLEILDDMEHRHRHMIDALSYSAAMQAWAKSGLPEAPMKAEALLKKMLPDIAPILQTYEALMDAHARSPTGSSTRVFELLSLLEKLSFTDKMRPTVRSYAAALLSIALNPTPVSSQQAEAVMERMVQFGVTPNSHCYSLLITTYGADVKNTEAGYKAVQALAKMKESGERPNDHVYTSVISALGNHRNSKLAKEVWNQAQADGHQMSVTPFNALLNALRQDGTIESAMEAETMLRSYMKSHQPNEITFATVMGAWAQFGRVDRTLALFNEMKRDYPALCNLHVYTTVMNAYVMSDDPQEAAPQVEWLLQEYPMLVLRLTTLLSRLLLRRLPKLTPTEKRPLHYSSTWRSNTGGLATNL